MAMVVGSDSGVAGDGSDDADDDNDDDDEEDGDPNFCVAIELFLVEEKTDVEIVHGLLHSDLWRSIVVRIKACIILFRADNHIEFSFNDSKMSISKDIEECCTSGKDLLVLTRKIPSNCRCKRVKPHLFEAKTRCDESQVNNPEKYSLC